MKIFVAGTGRNGSKFMSSVVKLLTELPAFHENRPHLIGQAMKEINDGCVGPETAALMREKVEKVKCYPDYFESSNVFIKSWIWPFLDEFDDMHVVYLHRNPIDVFMSHGERNFKLGLDWFLQPHWMRNYLRTVRPMGFLELINWNWYEVRERFLRLQDRFVKTYDFDFRKIADLEEYYKMFDHFGVPYKRIDALPDFDRNTNTGETVVGRYDGIMETLNTRWDEPGVEWVFAPRDK